MKRFYKDVSVQGGAEGFAVLLDGRPVKTPGHNGLVLPTRALAEAIAGEWRAQDGEIVPTTMPLLRLANTVIDGIALNREDVIGAILRFGENDLLCYRAEQPRELAALQARNWDPLLAWAARRYGVTFQTTAGFTHIDQPADTLAVLRAAVRGYDAFALAALHVVASIAGSLVLALALAEGETTPARLFELARLDEDYQAGKWGQDTEAQVRATALARELDKAAEFLAASRR